MPEKNRNIKYVDTGGTENGRQRDRADKETESDRAQQR